MTFRAAGRKGTSGRGRQQSRVSIPGIGAATAFARLIEMPELVLGPHGTISNFRFCNVHQHAGRISDSPSPLKLARPTKDPWQMLLIPEFELS
jgi:hypothetical protein